MKKEVMDFLLIPVFVFAMIYAISYKYKKIQEDQKQIQSPYMGFVIK